VEDEATMRVCPKCGHVDSPIWKQSAFHQNISFTTLSNIEFETPQLAEKLRQNRFYSDGVYAYKLTKFLRVERQAIIDNPNWKKHWDIPAEKSKGMSKLPKQWHNPATLYRRKIYSDKTQRRLDEEMKP